MKKFDIEQELKKTKIKKKSYNSSRLSNSYVPILIVACCSLAMVGVAFSSKLTNDMIEEHTIRIEIIGGENETYVKKVKQGAFIDTIKGNGDFGSLTCVTGNLSYDPLTSTISSPYVNSNVNCVLSFMENGTKEIAINQLNPISDNYGTSYYFLASSENNYVKINDNLFRIVRINGDGSIRLVLDKNINSVDYGNVSNFSDSNVFQTLINWYNSNFYNIDYVIDGDFDSFDYEGYFTNNLISELGYTLSKVGTLSVREVDIITKGCIDSNYLKSTSGMYLMNTSGEGRAYAYVNGEIVTVTYDTVLGVRPVINIKAVDLAGDGSIDNPFIINE